MFNMVGKINQLKGRCVLVTGLILGYGHLELSALELSATDFAVPAYKSLEIPYLQGWTDRSKYDSRVAIGTSIAKIDDVKQLIESYALGKNFNPNQYVIIGYSLPLINFAATLPNADVLKKILADNSALVSIETAQGNTPLHFAAANAKICLKALIDDGRLDVNEHNYNGETPLYIAMKYNVLSAEEQETSVSILLNCPRIKINSRDNKGRTMLHIAIIFGDENVVKQILNLKSSDGRYGEENQYLDVNLKDDAGRTPADYLSAIKDAGIKANLQILLHGVDAEYGDGFSVAHPFESA